MNFVFHALGFTCADVSTILSLSSSAHLIIGLNYVPDPFNIISSEVDDGIRDGLSKEELLRKIVPRVKEARADFDECLANRVATNMVETALRATNPTARTRVDDEVGVNDVNETLAAPLFDQDRNGNTESEENIAANEISLLTYKELQAACMDRGIRGNQRMETLRSRTIDSSMN